MAFLHFATVLLAALAPLASGGFGATATTTVPPQQEDMLGAIRELAEPGPEHEIVRRHEGVWEIIGELAVPDGPAIAVRGTIDAQVVMGGRYVDALYSGEFDGTAYEARVIHGFDANTGEFLQIWYSDFEPGMLRYVGRCDSSCETQEYEVPLVDPIWGHPMTSRSTWTWLDDDTYRFTADLIHEDGREFRQFHYTASRVRQ